MISSLNDGAVGQLISRAAFVLVRLTPCAGPRASSPKSEHQPFTDMLTFCSIMSQNTSWSCLNVSLESFHNIVNGHNFSDNVYDVVQAFRRRWSDIQQFRWSACRVRLSSPEDDRYGQFLTPLTIVASLLMSSAEICYRIQYPVRNNRNRGDPFSMRQIGVCQKNDGPRNSTWIILQPSLEILNRLELTLKKSDFISVHEKDPMSLHLIFLDFQSINWDDFVEHLRISLEPLVFSPDLDNHYPMLTSAPG